MIQEERVSQRSFTKRKWYDLLGQYGIPIAHPGGTMATKELLEMCQVDENTKVLDVGCGTGWTACEIAKWYGSQVVGIDLSEKMVASAKEKARKQKLEDKIEFRVADVFQLPFDDETFDVIIFESLLNVLPRKLDALNEMVRVLRPGGRVGGNEVFTVPSTPPELLERLEATFFFTESLFTPEGLRGLFEDAGLHVVQMIEKPSKGAYSSMELLKTWGFLKFMSVIPRLWWKLLTDSDIRRAEREDNEVTKIMFKQKDTREFFGFALIVGQKPVFLK